MDTLKPVILLTRPVRQAAAFCELLDGAAEIVVSPVLEIRQLSVEVDLRKYAALVFPSQNAVWAASNSFSMKDVNAFAVGDKTAEAARKVGMNARSAGGNSDDLVGTIIKANPTGPLLLMRGRHSVGNIESRLKQAGIDTDSVICYDQKPLPLSEDAKLLLGDVAPVIVPLFSPRSAALLAKEVGQLDVKAPLTLIAISQAALKAWDWSGPAETVVAVDSTADAVAKEILRRIRGSS